MGVIETKPKPPPWSRAISVTDENGLATAAREAKAIAEQSPKLSHSLPSIDGQHWLDVVHEAAKAIREERKNSSEKETQSK